MEEQFIHQNRVRQLFFLAALVLWGVLLVMELYSFLPALLGSITLYIICRKWMVYLVEVRGWKRSLAASLLMFLTFLIILIPIGLLVQMMSSKISYVIEHSNELVQSLQVLISNVEQRFNIEIMNTDNINKLGGFIASIAPKILNATFSTLVTIFFMYFILFFMLVNGREMEQGMYTYIPLKDENVAKIGKEMESLVYSNAVGI